MRVHAQSDTEMPRVAFKYGDEPNTITQLALADVNGDGRKDFVLGSTIADRFQPRIDRSPAYVIFNTPNMPPVIDLSTDIGPLGYKMTIAQPSDDCGSEAFGMENAGDMNGDGREDILVSTFVGCAGVSLVQHAYLLWGKADTSPIDLNGANASQGVDFDHLPGAEGGVIRPFVAGDMNGDGYADLAFGVRQDNGDWVDVIYGRRAWPSSFDFDNLSSSDGFRIHGNRESLTGWSTVPAGDVNGDGIDDLALDVINDVGSPAPTASAVYVIFGTRNPTDININNLGTQGYRIYTSAYISPSAALVNAGDITGDGLPDLVVTAGVIGVLSNPGRVWLVPGQASTDSINLDTLPANITEGEFTNSISFDTAGDAGTFFSSAPFDAGYNGAEVGGRMLGTPLSALATPQTWPNPTVGYMIQGATPGMRLGWSLADGSADGELLVGVGSIYSGYDAVVVPERSANITLPVDQVLLPTIGANVNPTPNAQGWENQDTSLSWNVTDATTSSGCAATAVMQDTPTEGITFVCSATNRGGTSTKSATIKLDKTAPALSTPTWTTNPKPTTASTTLTVHTTDAASGIANAEYYIGGTDPGLGNGTPMALNNAQTNAGGAITGADLTASIGTNFQPGVYNITLRARDNAGNWSAPLNDYLVVFDPSGPTDVAASKKAVPQLANGDNLPGLLNDAQNDKANLGFDVFLTAAGTVDSRSQLSLNYSTGKACNSPHPSNCHNTTFAVTTLSPNTINWLVITGTTGSVGKFQGQGTLIIDGTTTTNPFSVQATDGARTTPISSDDAILRIYAPGANPETATALYQLHEAASGNWVKIQ